MRKIDRPTFMLRLLALSFLSGVGTCVSPAACATDGVLDATFGDGGRVTVNSWEESLQPKAMAVDGQGRIVLGGTVLHYPSLLSHFMLMRLLADGSLDATFASDQSGIFSFDFGLNGIGPSAGSEGQAVLIQPDGKIVVGGQAKSNSSQSQFGLLRVDDTGQLDIGFGVGGSAHFGTASSVNVRMNSLALDSAGHIVGAGTSSWWIWSGYQNAAATFRLTPAGRYDPSFYSGYVNDTFYWVSPNSNPPQAQYNTTFALGLAANGDILAAGTSDTPSPSQAGVLRLRDDGFLDTTFGDAGRQQIGIPNGIVGAIYPLPSGATMVAGRGSDAEGNSALFLAKLTSAGVADASFGTAGIVLFPNPRSSLPSLLAPTKHGGWLIVSADFQVGFTLVRTDKLGHVDPDFADGSGSVFIAGDVYEALYYAAKPVLLADGKLLAVGYVPEADWNGSYDFSVMRILADTDTIFFSDFEESP